MKDLYKKIKKNYEKVKYLRVSSNNLQFYLDQFNHEDYYIYKSTRKFKEVIYQDLLEFKYARYILFKKDLYTKKYLDMWIEFLSKIRNLRVYYLDKPFPPFNPEDKIKIKK